MVLEDIGWGTTEHWMRMQASYELAEAWRDRAAVPLAAVRPPAPLPVRGRVFQSLRSGPCSLMRLSWNEVPSRAVFFADDWRDAAYEKGQRRASTTRSSWYSECSAGASRATRRMSRRCTAARASSTCSGRACCSSNRRAPDTRRCGTVDERDPCMNRLRISLVEQVHRSKVTFTI